MKQKKNKPKMNIERLEKIISMSLSTLWEIIVSLLSICGWLLLYLGAMASIFLSYKLFPTQIISFSKPFMGLFSLLFSLIGFLIWGLIVFGCCYIIVKLFKFLFKFKKRK